MKSHQTDAHISNIFQLDINYNRIIYEKKKVKNQSFVDVHRKNKKANDYKIKIEIVYVCLFVYFIFHFIVALY